MADSTEADGCVPPGPFSRLVEPGQIRDAREIRYTPDDAEKGAIAAHLSLTSVDQFEGIVTLRPWRRHGLRVNGELNAVVGQVCTVTAEAMTSKVTETIDERLYPAARNDKPKPEAIIDVEATDDFEEFEGEAVDIGGLLLEYLAMGIDPYPRKDGAKPAAPVSQEDDLPEEDKRPSPFASLAGRFGHSSTPEE